MSEKMIKVKFIGTKPRSNVWGHFEPNKTYEIGESVARELCKVPRLFQNLDPLPDLRKQRVPEGPQRPRKIVIDGEPVIDNAYEGLGVRKLKEICKERKIKVPRNIRREGILALLVNYDQTVRDG